MKKNVFLAFFALALLSVSCDKILVGERVKNPTGDNGPVPANGLQQKVVLIEEFTGITCNTCPKAAAEIKTIEEIFPGRVNVIGMHVSNFAIPQPPDYPADFRTNAGTEIYNFARPFGVPSALINRKDYNTAHFAKPFRSFASEVEELIETGAADIALELEASYASSTKQASVNITFSNQKTLDYAPELYWMAVLTESKIIAAQKLPDNSKDPDYEHNHVLRASFNGNFGTPLANHGFGPDDSSAANARLTLNNDWVAANCKIVVFVYDANTQEVIQSAAVALK